MYAATGIARNQHAPQVEATLTLVRTPAAGLTLSLHHDLAELRDLWIAFEETADCTVFQTYEWLAAYQQFIGAPGGEIPCIALVRFGNGSMACLLPLAIRQTGFVRELTWLGDVLCDYTAPLLAPGFTATVGQDGFRVLWRDLLSRLQSDRRTAFDVVRLTKMPQHVQGQLNPLLGVVPTTLNASAAYETPLAESWDAFYAAKRAASSRSRDRSKRKRIAECGEILFQTAETAVEITQALDTLMVQKAAVFAHHHIRNIFVRPGHAAFYRAVAADPRFRRIAHVSKLEVGATVAAVNLGLTFRGRYYHVLSSYTDGPLARFSPGMIHLHELMRYAIGRGLTSFDFTIGDERYKREWCEDVCPIYDHVATATTRGALVSLPLHARLRLKRVIKQTPILWTSFNKARAFLSRGKKS